MLVLKKHCKDADAKDTLINAMNSLISDYSRKPVFIGIGSDRHILDCMGPLVGSMIAEKIPEIIMYGTLDAPVHAKNLSGIMEEVNSKYPGRVHIAIDASVGEDLDLGIIKIQKGSIIPGRALAKSLPPVGDISITGVVGPKFTRKNSQIFHGSLSHVYQMARVISESICEWHMRIF